MHEDFLTCGWINARYVDWSAGWESLGRFPGPYTHTHEPSTFDEPYKSGRDASGLEFGHGIDDLGLRDATRPSS
jgi:hypothetical protein